MEKDLDIAKILETKSVGTKLYSPIIGECQYYTIFGSNILVNNKDGVIYSFSSEGRFIDDVGECLLFPSKSMRDWSKFAWKKGDVLFSNNTLVVFNRFVNNDYTDFEAAFEGYQNETYDEGNIFYTDDFSKATDDGAKDFIKNIEGHYDGKLNLETLEIEKPESQFKNGDIVVVDYVEGVVFICICNKVEDNFMYCHARMNSHNKDLYLKKAFLKVNLVNRNPRYATVEKAQELFSALAKKGKRWNSETKTLEDLPKKCEFKPFDKVLVKHEEEYEWMIDFFSHYDKDDEMPFVCMTGRAVKCIPYNDKTAHLLGTNDDYEEGGEE